ncbi:MAG TPA: hypothetical protein VMU04_10155 [Candidatus Acidoferrum sp.]|nr:hypothetical protein [Candidatus Acidoferrum sp.]
MNPTSPFEVTRRDASINASANFTPAPGFDPVPRGFALGAHATDSTAFDVAQHNTFIGHLTRMMRVGGMTVTDRFFGMTSETPIGVESPFISGQECTIQKAKEIEAEGSAYLVTSGVRAIQPNTAVGTNLSFCNGYLGLTQPGETPNYVLTAILPASFTPGALRIRAERYAG